jgi:hypothetical protein
MTDNLPAAAVVNKAIVNGRDFLPPIATGAGAGYELCEMYYFRSPKLRPGFRVCNGGLITDADINHPKAWAYLQTADGRLLCLTEAAWQTMSTAAGGVGGVPFFVVDTEARTIRLPDTRGDYPRCAGGGTMQNVGDWHGDAIRNITANEAPIASGAGSGNPQGTILNYGAIKLVVGSLLNAPAGSGSSRYVSMFFDASRVVPTAAENRMRGFGVLPCVYLGGV